MEQLESEEEREHGSGEFQSEGPEVATGQVSCFADSAGYKGEKCESRQIRYPYPYTYMTE